MEDKQPPSREEALKEWEKDRQASLVANNRSNIKFMGIVLILITLLALFGLWYAKNSHNPDESAKSKAREIEIAEKKAVTPMPADTPAASGEPASAPTPAEVVAVPDNQAREEMKQRAEQERRMREARLKSSLMAKGSSGSSSASEPAGNAQTMAPGGLSAQLGGAPEKGAQDANSKFARAVSGQAVATSQARQLTQLEHKILQGKLIEAVLEPRAISDLPGMVCATVQRDVFSHQGRNKLIPWGSRVCGVYSGDLRKGQERLFVVWNTLRRPDGIEVTLDSVGADQLGSVGLGGQVDSHFAEIFGISALLSIIGAGASTTGVQSGDDYNSQAYYRQSVQQAAAQTAQQVLQPYVNIPPTVTVPAGAKVRIYVNRDLDFSEVQKEKAAQSNEPAYIF